MGWKRVAVPDLESAKPLEVRLKGRVGQAEGSESSHVTSERPPERPGLDATTPRPGPGVVVASCSRPARGRSWLARGGQPLVEPGGGSLAGAAFSWFFPL